MHGTSVEEALKRNFFELIEDEYDAAVADAAYRDYLANPKTYSHEEVWNALLGDE